MASVTFITAQVPAKTRSVVTQIRIKGILFCRFRSEPTENLRKYFCYYHKFILEFLKYKYFNAYVIRREKYYLITLTLYIYRFNLMFFYLVYSST